MNKSMFSKFVEIFPTSHDEFLLKTSAFLECTKQIATRQFIIK